MKQVIFSVMITCWAAVCVAQQFHGGLGAGFRKTTSGNLTIDGTTLAITNPHDERFLVPAIAYRYSPGNKWFLEAGLQYQTGGISLQVYDLAIPGCILCPVRKGSLVSYRELLPSVSVGYTFIELADWRLDFSAGFMPALRFGIRQSPTEGLQHLSPQALTLLAGGSDLVKKSYWNGRITFALFWKRWSLNYQYCFLLDRSTASTLVINDTGYDIALDQKL
jgi:hypothetical protein